MTRPKQAIAPPGTDPTLGPAMRALPSDQMRDFVRLLVTGNYNGTEAAEIAGYSASSRNVLNAKASDLNRDPRIQAALREECLKVIATHGPKAIATLVEIASNPRAADRDRIKAATELLNRGGLSSVTKHDVSVTVSVTDAEKDREILALATELGLDQTATQKLLGYKPPPIDADFVEIIDPPSDIAPPAQPGRGPRITKDIPGAAEVRAVKRMRWHRARTETPEEREARVERAKEKARIAGKLKFIDAQLERGEIREGEAEVLRAEALASKVPVEILAKEVEDDAWME